MLAINDAFDKLAGQQQIEAELVQLRFFVGRTIEQAAEFVDISLAPHREILLDPRPRVALPGDRTAGSPGTAWFGLKSERDIACKGFVPGYVPRVHVFCRRNSRAPAEGEPSL